MGYSSPDVQLERYEGSTVFNKVIYSLTLRIANPYFAQKKFFDGKDCSREDLSMIRKSRALD